MPSLFHFTPYALESRIRNCDISFDVIWNLASHMRTHTPAVTKHPGEGDTQLRLRDLVFWFDGSQSLVGCFGSFFRNALHCLLSQFSDFETC